MKTRTNLFFVALVGLLALCGTVEGSELTEGLISHWTLDEGSGDIAYDSGGSNHGTVYGAVWTTGQIDGALSFDGIDDYVDIPYDSSLDINPSDGITVSAWIKLDSYPDSTHQAPVFGLFSSTSTGAKNYLLIHKSIHGNKIAWAQHPPGYGNLNSIKPDLDTWYYVAVVQNSTYRAIYINGILDSSDNSPESYSGDTPDTIRIGGSANDSTSYHFDGTIDDVRIYNRVLSPEEVRQLYANGLDKYECAITNIMDAIAEKLQEIENIEATMENELVAVDALDQLLESGELSNSEEKDVKKAKEKILSTLKEKEDCIKKLEKAIKELQDALVLLGWEPEP